MFDHCPRCGESLRPGFLRSGQRSILWTPSEENKGFYIPSGEGEFSLPGKDLLHGAKCPARYCGHCGLILIETNEEEAT